MWIRALSLFLVIQILSFSLWSSFYKENVQATTSMESNLHQSTDIPLNAAESLSVDFSARSLETDYESLYEAQRTRIENILTWLPAEHRHSVKEVTLNYHQDASRGLGGQGKVILGSLKMDDDKELTSVFIHEVGHNVAWSLKADEAGEPSPFYDGKTRLHENDPIVDFFKISWQDSETQQPDADATDFVSGYARTNAHEDFAESYNYYINQGLVFLSLVEKNEALKAKYEFLRDQVFDGMEFETGKPIENQTFRPWDVTKLEYDETIYGI